MVEGEVWRIADFTLCKQNMNYEKQTLTSPAVHNLKWLYIKREEPLAAYTFGNYLRSGVTTDKAHCKRQMCSSFVQVIDRISSGPAACSVNRNMNMSVCAVGCVWSPHSRKSVRSNKHMDVLAKPG